MLQPFVIGLGRAGSGLHLRVLAQAREVAPGLFADGPVVACDPDVRRHRPDVTLVDSIGAAAASLDPHRTVVHVCTPPQGRAGLLAELAEHGFRRVIAEKPLATSLEELAAIETIRDRHDMDIAVVSHWLESRLTEHLIGLVARGGLRSVTFDQDKPRFTRSCATTGHPTAFDVELPHSLGVVLRLAGAAELAEAECADMRVADTVLPRLGSARLVLDHAGGVRSEIRSDLTAPIRRRRISLELDSGTVVGHYPIGADDDHAQLEINGRRVVFRDDALTRWMVRAYVHHHRPAGEHGTFDLHADIIRLLTAAKERTLAHAR
ncbi:Gfo/Idh/MocA family oxidoreductase [Saccharopolyspora flava]|uniref:Oxidoreductase family, NAD-binding Rossmann fold n=1 Tax=Saccharopolyspora flava TaxID=95161 RepID=A0A1I6S831_9PSEU|nr:Gfo/Idh/MocA family oxidoreductase [Saccharopolyspora flava]SFS73086.1 Oxidoreductase family, NAD-binding Rossmann fold [Saccharopolyspora flava]